MLATLTRPLPPSPAFANGMLALAVILPSIVMCLPSLTASMLATGLALRAKGRLKVDRLGWPKQPGNLFSLALVVCGAAWSAGLYLFATA